MRKPSPAMIVALAALFVALGGVGVAATGGTFILGRSNSANNTTALAYGVTTGPTLELSNSGGKPAARFNTPSGVQPFVVNNPTKVQNLNADKLDGFDSAHFLPKTGKAADSDKLDGRDSSGFIQGIGSAYQRRISVAPPDANSVTATVLTIPGLGEVEGVCLPGQFGPYSALSFHNSSGETLAATWSKLSSLNSRSIAPNESAELFVLTSSSDMAVLQVGTDAKAATVVASKFFVFAGVCGFHAQAANIG